MVNSLLLQANIANSYFSVFWNRYSQNIDKNVFDIRLKMIWKSSFTIK